MTVANNDHYVLGTTQRHPIEVQQLRYSQFPFFHVHGKKFTHSYTGQIFKAAKTLTEAGAGDPVLLYLRNVSVTEYFSDLYSGGTNFDGDFQNRRRSPIGRVGERVRTAAVVALWIRTKVALTVNGGTSTLIA